MRFLCAFALVLHIASVTGLAGESAPGEPALNSGAGSDRSVLAEAEAKKWVSRFEKLLPKGWTVSRDADVLTIERNEPVQSINEMNGPPAPQSETPEERKAREKTHVASVAYRIKLKFVPRISQDQFEELAAVNKTTLAEAEKLRTKMKLRNISHKFNQYVPRNAEERERLASYNDAVGKLPYHELPDCYTPDFSVFYQTGWSSLTRLYDKDEYHECLNVEHSLLRLFGVYNVTLAKAGFPHWSNDPGASAAQRGLVEIIGNEERPAVANPD
jgi:hypothetical protein